MMHFSTHTKKKKKTQWEEVVLALSLFTASCKTQSQWRGNHSGEADIKTKWCNKTMRERQLFQCIIISESAVSQQKRRERMRKKDRGFKQGRLSGRLTDGWCKGERREKMN